MDSSVGNFNASSRAPANDPDFDRGVYIDNPTLVNTRISKRRVPPNVGISGDSLQNLSNVGVGGSSLQTPTGSVGPSMASDTPPRLSTSKPSVKYKTSLLASYYDTDLNISVDKLVSEIQTAYYDISKLEVACSNLIEALDKAPFNERFSELYQLQTNLVDRYYDFMFLAHHPSGNAFTKGLTKKYKIAIRMWNKGIFKFLDLLRTRVPESHSLVNKFIYHCFALLGMLVDPPYESRHMWLEALGDLARFMMAIGSSGYGDWRSAAQYWYIRASNRSPGIGRLFHHCAVVCIYRIDSLFYFCKSLTAVQPFEPSRDIITSLFASNQDNENESAAGKFIKMHEIMFGSGPISTIDSLAESIGWTIANSGSQLYELKHRAAIMAFCDIAALLGYGRNMLAKLFCDKSKSTLDLYIPGLTGPPNSSPAPSTNPAAANPIPFVPVHNPFSLLQAFLRLEKTAGSPHAVVWLYFLISLNDATGGQHIHAVFPQFPIDDLVHYLNEVLVYVTTRYVGTSGGDLRQRLAYWRKTSDEPLPSDYLESLRRQIAEEKEIHIDPIPIARERPLSEELLMQGFIWSPPMRADLVAEHECSAIDDLCPAFPGPACIAPIRLVRVVELGLELADRCSWLTHDGEFRS